MTTVIHYFVILFEKTKEHLYEEGVL